MKRKEFAEDSNSNSSRGCNSEDDSEEERRFDSEEDSDMYDIEEGISFLSLDPPPTKKALSESGLVRQLGSMNLDCGDNRGRTDAGSKHERNVVYYGNGIFVADEDPEGEGGSGGGSVSTPSLSDTDDLVLPSIEE